MAEMHADDPIDMLLRRALADRPEPIIDTDFAARALATAETPALLHAPAVWPVWAAIVGVAALVVLAVWRLSDTHAWRSADSVLQQTSTNTSVALLPIGGALFIITLALVIARPALSSSEQANLGGIG